MMMLQALIRLAMILTSVRRTMAIVETHSFIPVRIIKLRRQHVPTSTSVRRIMVIAAILNSTPVQIIKVQRRHAQTSMSAPRTMADVVQTPSAQIMQVVSTVSAILDTSLQEMA